MMTKSFETMPRPRSSPWGQIDWAEQVAPGIWSVTTPSHGGYLISRERLGAMPGVLRINQGYHTDACAFEEDCEWALVVLAFPHLFSIPQVEAARETAKMTAGFNQESSPRWARVAAAYPIVPQAPKGWQEVPAGLEAE